MSRIKRWIADEFGEDADLEELAKNQERGRYGKR